MDPAASVDALLRAVPSGGGAGARGAGLNAAVLELVQSAGVDATRAPSFCAFVGERLAGEEAADVPAALRRLVAKDLAVAWGCLRGDPAAITLLERDYLPSVRTALSRMRADDATIDDQLQELRARILVGDGRGPLLAEYRGHGALRRWLRVTVVRRYLNVLRDGGREIAAGDPGDLDALAPGADQELAYLKERYRPVFAEAVAAAAAALDALDRAVLRYTFVDRLGLDALGKALRVSRATAQRRLTAAREALLAAIQRELAARLFLGSDEVASLYRLVKSELPLSVGRILAAGAAPKDGAR